MLHLILLLAIAQDPKPSPSPKPVFLPDSYAHPFYAYKIYLPARWQKGESKGKVQSSFYGPRDGTLMPRMDLSIKKIAGELEGLVGQYQKAFEKEFPDIKFTRYEGITGRAGDGRIFICEFKDGSNEMTAIWVFFKPGERLFSMGFSTPRTLADKYVPLMEASMRSIRIHEEPKETTEQQQEFVKAYNQGETAYRSGSLDDALKAFLKAMEIMPDFGEVHSAVAIIHMKRKNFKSAEAELRKAIETDPDDYRFNFDLGSCLLQQEKYKAAIEVIEKAAKLDPTSEPALTNLGVAYINDDQASKAAETLEKAVKADPESATAHYNLGMAYEKLAKKKEAVAEFKETLKIDPKHKGAADGVKRIKL